MSRVLVVIPHYAGPVERAVAACGDHPVHVVDDRERGEGFARAANRGLAEAQRRGHDVALLLNDDAAPRPGCIEALLDAFSDDVALAGPVLETPQGDVESAGIRFVETTGRLTQITQVPPGPTQVDALSGACLLLRSAFRFDEAFPHAMEDVDLARRVDGRVLLVPEARCRHIGGASKDRTSREATRDALKGHMRLVDSPVKRGLVTGYAVLQVLREGNRRERLIGIVEALASG